MYSIFRKLMIIFQITVISSMPLFPFHIINLDFSGLKNLSKLSEDLNKLSKYKIEKTNKTFKNTLFEKETIDKKFTQEEAFKRCDSLSVDGQSVWYLPTFKDMLSLSSNKPLKMENNISVYIKKDYFQILPKVKTSDDLTFWTSNLTVENGYELGEIVSFAYSFNELENAPIDLSSDKRSKHFVICKKSDDVINIKWEDNKFLSIFGNNFRLSKKLKFIGSFDLEDKSPKIIDYKNSEAYFPLKNFLLILSDKNILYILDLENRKFISKIRIKKGEILYLLDLKKLIIKNKG